MTAIEDQPPPIHNDNESIHALVRKDLEQRESIGLERYGTALQAGNGRNSLIDAYQELLDGACYLRQAIEEGSFVGRHGADDTPPMSYATLTPGRLLARILDGDTEERLEILTKMLGNSRQGWECFSSDHTGQMQMLRVRVSELSRALVRVMSGIPISPDADIAVIAKVEAERGSQHRL